MGWTRINVCVTYKSTYHKPWCIMSTACLIHKYYIRNVVCTRIIEKKIYIYIYIYDFDKNYGNVNDGSKTKNEKQKYTLQSKYK